MAEREDAYTFDSYKQALAASGRASRQAARTGEQNAQSGKGKERGKGGGKGKGKGKGGSTSDEAAPSSGWVEKKQSIPDAKFQAIRKAAIAKYPGSCGMWLVAKCTRGSSCTREHKRPEDFAEFLSQNGLNLDGSEKCKSPPLSHPPLMHASSMPRAQHAPLSDSEGAEPKRPAAPAQSSASLASHLDEQPSSAAHSSEAAANPPKQPGTGSASPPSEGPPSPPGVSEAQSTPPSQRRGGLRALRISWGDRPNQALSPAPTQSEAASGQAATSLGGLSSAAQASAAHTSACHPSPPLRAVTCMPAVTLTGQLQRRERAAS